jgi:hypothetical protein
VFSPAVPWQRLLTMNILQLLAFRCFLGDGSLLTAFFSHRLSYIIDSVKVKVTLRLTVSRPVFLWIKHPPGELDQIFITVRQLQACWCGALSLTRGRVCRLPESQSAVISLLSVCTIYILRVIRCMYVYIQHIQGLRHPRLSTAGSNSQSQGQLATDG